MGLKLKSTDQGKYTVVQMFLLSGEREGTSPLNKTDKNKKTYNQPNEKYMRDVYVCNVTMSGAAVLKSEKCNFINIMSMPCGDGCWGLIKQRRIFINSGSVRICHFNS